MTFLDNIKKAVSKTTKTAVKKTEKFVDNSKIKYAIFDLQNEVEQLYSQLGEKVYKSYKADENIADFVEEKCSEIDSLNEKISDLKGKLG